MKFKIAVCAAITAAMLCGGVYCAAETEVYAEETVMNTYASGTYYDRWNIWFDKTSGYITGYDGTAQTLTLPAEIDGTTVVGIADSAFKGAGFNTVNLPGSLTLIGYKAFENCTGLTEITIPKNVIETKTSTIYALYGNWFIGCSSLKKVVFEEGTTTILREVLANSTVTDVVIPSTVTQINYQAFKNMKSLKSISLPESLTVIGEEAFSGCSSLENISVPKYVTNINDGAFKDCSSLNDVKLGNGLTLLGYKAFENCTSLTEITIPKNVTETRTSTIYALYGNWFIGCSSLKKVTFSDRFST